MKKILLSFLILTASVVSHALPALNDYAKFDVTIIDGKTEIKLIEEMKLVEFDEPSKIFLMELNLKIRDAVQTKNVGVKYDDLYTDRALKSIVEMCKMGHGVNQILIVKGQAMNTCRFNVEDADAKGFRWYGVVPFGIVKEEFVAKNGNKMTRQMVDYTFGK